MVQIMVKNSPCRTPTQTGHSKKKKLAGMKIAEAADPEYWAKRSASLRAYYDRKRRWDYLAGITDTWEASADALYARNRRARKRAEREVTVHRPRVTSV
jgi:hypothetical protein